MPRASGRKERLGASGLTRALCPAAPRCRRGGARAGAALERVGLSEEVMAKCSVTEASLSYSN